MISGRTKPSFLDVREIHQTSTKGIGRGTLFHGNGLRVYRQTATVLHEAGEAMIKSKLFIPLLLALLVGCSESKPEVALDTDPAVKQDVESDVEPEVEYLSIHALCESENATPEQVQEFLDLRVDVNAKTGSGRTPLMLAAAYNKNPEVISLLLKAGADVNAKVESDTTPLMYAARNNENPEVISVLLEAGADAKVKNIEGKTALDYAKNNKSIEDTPVYWKLNDATFD